MTWDQDCCWLFSSLERTSAWDTWAPSPLEPTCGGSGFLLPWLFGYGSCWSTPGSTDHDVSMSCPVLVMFKCLDYNMYLGHSVTTCSVMEILATPSNSSQPSMNATNITTGSNWTSLATGHCPRNQKESIENWCLLVIVSLGAVDPPSQLPEVPSNPH